jgi:glycine/D-amino acid oxidase-like deaminating enzyme
MSAPSEEVDFVVIGGGTFGTSIVKDLIRESPDVRIAWVQGAERQTASRDKTKIVRATYIDEDYVCLGEEVFDIWRNDPLYAPFFNWNGWIYIKQGDQKSTIEGAYDREVSVEEMKGKLGPDFAPNLDANERLWYNENTGVANFAEAVRAVGKAALECDGVRRIQEDATKLIVREGVCVGVEVGGQTFVAKEETILASGAWTPGLLKRSGIAHPEDFFIIAGVPVAEMALEGKEFDELESAPTLVIEQGIFTFH